MNKHRTLAITTAILLCICRAASAAQSPYPDKAIRIVAPFPPGGNADVLARDIAHRLNAKWGQPAVVDNRPGANGNIGAEIVAKARPDGYTVLIGTANIAISATLYKNLGYDLLHDLAPISLIATGPYVLITPSALPVRTLGEFIALAKAKPGQLMMASTGTGSPGHLAGELLQSAAGIRLTHVPYKGQAPALVDLIGGQVAMLFASTVAVSPHLGGGKIRALAVTTAKRSTLLPEVPTMAQSGVPGFDVGAWIGAFVPARTPRDVVAKLNEEIVSFANAADARNTYVRQGLELVSDTPEAYAQFLQSEVRQYEKVTRHLDLKAE